MTDYIKEAQALFEYTRDMRRDFHMNPELGLKEIRTAGIVSRELTALGLEVATGIAVRRGGCRGVNPVRGAGGPTGRSPITEETGAGYAQEPGVMHACGHDGHTAIPFAVAKSPTHRSELAGVNCLPARRGAGKWRKMIRREC
jgi:metal-dependent amidase/aminoacylase/carboxypeptidase family protein